MAFSMFDIGCCCGATPDPCSNACATSPWFDDFSVDSSSSYEDFTGGSISITGGKVYSPDIRPSDVTVGKCFNVPVAFTVIEAEVDYELTTADAHFLEVTAVGVTTYLGTSTSGGALSVLRKSSGGSNLDTDAAIYATGKLRVVITDVGSGNIQIDRIVSSGGTPYLSHTETVSRVSESLDSGSATDGYLCGYGFAFRGGAAALSSTDECYWDNFLADWTV